MLIQTNNDKKTTTYYDTIAELEDILDDLNVDEDKEYNFKISAIMTDGRATVVIIHDWNATHGEKGDKPETPAAGKYSSMIPTDDYAAAGKPGYTLFDMSGNDYALDGTDPAKIAKMNVYAGHDIAQQIKDYLAYEGYTEIGDVTYTTDANDDGTKTDAGYRVTATSPDGVKMPMYILSSALKSYIRVTLDTKTAYVAATGKSLSDVATATGVTFKGTYAKEGTTTNYVAKAATTLKNDTSYTSGYFKVSMDGTTPIDTAAPADVLEDKDNGSSVVIRGAGDDGAVYINANGTVTLDVTVKVKTGKTLAENGLAYTVSDTNTADITYAPNTKTDATHAAAAAEETATFSITLTLSGVPTATKDLVLKVTTAAHS